MTGEYFVQEYTSLADGKRRFRVVSVASPMLTDKAGLKAMDALHYGPYKPRSNAVGIARVFRRRQWCD
jgi:hypothetical protein